MTRKLWQLWGVVLVIKLAIAVFLPFAHDEAYYWFWSLHPQLSYFDHPAMVAWLLKIGHIFANWGQAERWPLVFLGHLSVLFWLDLLKDKLTEKRRVLFAALYFLFPLTGAGSVIATPDIPLLFFWSAAFWFFHRALHKKDFCSYMGLGASLGLGFCSKYHIVLFVPLIFLNLWYTRSWRLVQWRFVAITVIMGLLLSLPVIYWNFQNDFASFSFQLKHGFDKKIWTFWVPVIYIGGQLALLFPLLISAIKKSGFVLIPQQSLKGLNWLLPWILFPLGFFAISSLRAPVEANWTMVAFPPWLALAASVQEQHLKKVKATCLIWIMGILIIVTEVFFRWLPIDPQLWKIKEFFEYRDLPPHVAQYEPIYASSYQMAAQLTYLMGKPVYKVYGMARRDYFDELPEAIPKTKNYYVIVNRGWSWETPLQFQEHHKIARYQVHPDFDVLLIEVR